MKLIKRNNLVSVLVAACCLLGAGTSLADTTPIDKEASMDPRGRVSVSNVSGKVDVEGWSRSELKLTGTLGDNVERLEFHEDDGDVHIEVVLKKGKKGWNWRDRSGDSNLMLRIPEAARLSVDTVSADINVRDHLGSQALDSVSGDIEAVLGEEDCEVESVSGSVNLTGRDTDIELSAEAVSGDVRVSRFRGDIEAEAVSGDVIVRESHIGDGEFESVSGDIDLDITLDDSGSLEAESVSGSVSLRFEGSVNASFDIETHSGRIDDFWGNKARRTSEYGPGRELSFSVGSGSAEVSIATLSGSVRNRSGN